MKKTLLLIVIIAITVNSTPFLRHTEEITNATCTAQGKEFKEAKPPQCIKGSSIYNVTKETECIAGTWGKCSVNTNPKINKNDCTGNPSYDASTVKTKSTCKVKGTGKLVHEGKTQDECTAAVVFSGTGCNVTGVSVSDCQGSPSWVEVGTCKLPTSNADTFISFSNTNKVACEAYKFAWDTTENKCKVTTTIPGFDCSNSMLTKIGNDCFIPDTTITSEGSGTLCIDSTKATWEKINNENECAFQGIKIENIDGEEKCTVIKLGKTGTCSEDDKVTKEEDCAGVYTAPVYEVKCKLTKGQTTYELTDEERKKSSDACQAAINWDGNSCDGIGKNQTECEDRGTFSEGREASCEGGTSFASNLNYKYVLLVLISLLLF